MGDGIPMVRKLPKPLEDAVTRAIERETHGGATFDRRDVILRRVREVLDAWHAGDITTEDAVLLVEATRPGIDD